MSKESTENEIDDIFRKAIEPVSTEPSERFWQNAAEDVISRGSKSNRKSTSRWRAIAFILGVGLLALGYFLYKMESQLNTVERQMLTIKNAHPSSINKGNTNTGGNNSSIKANGNPSGINQNSKNHRQNITVNNSNHSTQSKSNKLQIAIAVASNKKVHRNKKSITPIAFNAKDKNAPNKKEENQVNDATRENSTNTIVSNDISSSAQKSAITNPENIRQSLTSISKKAPTIPAHDTSKIIQLSAIDTNPPRFSISAFFSPDFMMGYKYKSTESWGNQIESAIKTGEKQNFSYTAGIKAEYNLSSRFAVSVGLAYQVFSFNTAPCMVYAQQESDGDVGYYLNTSSGMVECPYYGNTKVGDSLKMNAVSTRTYLEIPLQIKYNFIDREKIKLYFNVGAEANICLAEKTTMNWQNSWNESGVANVDDVEGSETLYMAYYIGIGANYKIGKYLSVYLEPGLHEAITGLDNNTSPVITYPRLFSVTAGLTYYIK